MFVRFPSATLSWARAVKIECPRFSAVMIMLAVGLTALTALVPALAKDSIVPTIRQEKEEPDGWRLKTFDFGDEDLNFQTYVPDVAKVETTQMRKFDPSKEVGSVTIICKVTLADVHRDNDPKLSPDNAGGLCRKFSVGLRPTYLWTDLCCEFGKDLEWRTVIVGELVLADHMRRFDPCDGGRG